MKGHMTEAQSRGQQAVDLAVEAYGEGDIKVAESYVLVGDASRAMKDWPRAIHAYERAMAQRGLQGQGQEAFHVYVLNALGASYGEVGRNHDAIRVHKKQLAIAKNIFGQGHPEVATAMNNLGFAYLQAGDLSNAERLMMQQFAVLEAGGKTGSLDYAEGSTT